MGARELSPLELSPCLVFIWGKIQVIYSIKSRADSALVILGHPSWSHAPGASRGEAKSIPSLQKVKYFTSIMSDTKYFPVLSP